MHLSMQCPSTPYGGHTGYIGGTDKKFVPHTGDFDISVCACATCLHSKAATLTVLSCVRSCSCHVVRERKNGHERSACSSWSLLSCSSLQRQGRSLFEYSCCIFGRLSSWSYQYQAASADQGPAVGRRVSWPTGRSEYSRSQCVERRCDNSSWTGWFIL